MGRSAIVCVSDPSTPLDLPESMLRDLYGLTRAEVRLVMALWGGRSLKEVAEETDVSINTVRAMNIHQGP